MVPLVLAGLAGLGTSGCQDRLYSFAGTVGPGPTDAAVVDAPRAESGGDIVGPEVTGLGGHGGGGAGGSGGGGAGGSVGGGGGTVQTCDPNSPDRQTDIANCGACFNNCIAPNANPVCTAGACANTCLAGFFDADKDVKNGCECQRSNSGVEACDHLDNNCDGQVDEGFDFMTDINNCGGCSKPCFFPFANASCDQGVCKMGACLDGFYDRDAKVPGCETACQRTNGGVEICDGLDNDCNGTIDDNPMATTLTCKTRGVCAGITPTCMGQTGWLCKYPAATYQEVEDSTKTCDGLDNDCDGQVDEPFSIGKPCVVGSGPCAGTGVWVCDNSQASGHRCMGSMKTPGIEICNGQDDDCDGEVDELDTVSNRTTDDQVIYFAAKNVTIFAYEASRYDAKSDDHGFDSTRRPCSVPGKQPWSNVTKEEAEAACEKIAKGTTGAGWRLCTAAEWGDACNGTGAATFPYGNNYDGTLCNGYDYVKASGVTTIATGDATLCISALTATQNAFDMSGNVKEWALSTAATTGPFELRGGAYDIASFVDNSGASPVTRAPGLQCDSTVPAPVVDVRLPSVGFRCCRTGTLAP